MSPRILIFSLFHTDIGYRNNTRLSWRWEKSRLN